MENFKLPERWYIKITEENKTIVNEWKKNQTYNVDLFSTNIRYNYVSENGAGKFNMIGENREEITFDEFKQYVLNQTTIDKDEDYSYLIPILQELNIK